MSSNYNENENPANIFLDTLDINLGTVDIRMGSADGVFTTSNNIVNYDVAIQGYVEDLIQGSYKEKDGDRNKIQAELIINHGTDNTGLSNPDGTPKEIVITGLLKNHYYKIVDLDGKSGEFNGTNFKFETGHSGTGAVNDILNRCKEQVKLR